MLLLLTLNRRAAAALRRIVALPSGDLFARRLGVVVDGPRVSGHLEPRPVFRRTEALADRCVPPGSRVLDGLHVAGAHPARCGLPHRSGALRRGGSDRRHSQGERYHGDSSVRHKTPHVGYVYYGHYDSFTSPTACMLELQGPAANEKRRWSLCLKGWLYVAEAMAVFADPGAADPRGRVDAADHSRPGWRQERRMADLWGGPGANPLRAIYPEHRRELQQAGNRLALQDRPPRAAAGIQFRIDAAHGQWTALLNRRHEAGGCGARCRDRRNALDARRARRPARRRRAQTAVRPWPRVLDRRS